MDNVVKSEDYKNYRIDVVYDEDAANPRTEWDNATHIICHHSRYNLGDDQMTRDEFVEMFNKYKKKKNVVFSPLYLYDHSGITISMAPFGCRYDSGCVGFIYMTYEEIRKNWNIKKVTQEYIEKAQSLMAGEVEVYDSYIRGDVYGYKVTKIEKDEDGEDIDGEVIDSCYGFYGYDSQKEMIEDAKACCDNDEADRMALFPDVTSS